MPIPSRSRLLLDLQLNNQIFLRRAIAHAANRGGIPIVEARRDADIALVGRMAVADVEADPANMVEMRICPRMGRVLPRPVVHHQIARNVARRMRSEEHTSELQSLMRNSYAVFCLKKKKNHLPLSPHIPK